VTPRGIALGLGIAFALLTALELLLGDLSAGDAELLHRTTKANILHWVVALTMLGAFFARSSSASRTILRFAGMTLLVISVWGILWPAAFGTSLGFGGEVPIAYNAYHAAAALIALSGGFLLSGEGS
jgi:hypothetical protein